MDGPIATRYVRSEINTFGPWKFWNPWFASEPSGGAEDSENTKSGKCTPRPFLRRSPLALLDQQRPSFQLHMGVLLPVPMFRARAGGDGLLVRKQNKLRLIKQDHQPWPFLVDFQVSDPEISNSKWWEILPMIKVKGGWGRGECILNINTCMYIHIW